MTKVSFYCQNCGNETPKWHGKCPACKEWNTIVEEIKRIVTQNKAVSSTTAHNDGANKVKFIFLPYIFIPVMLVSQIHN